MEKAEGCQSLPPGGAGQTSFTTWSTFGCLASLYCKRPDFRSTPVLLVIGTNGLAERTSPVSRSRT